MNSERIIYKKKNPPIFNSKIKSEFRENFDMIQKYKNLFRKKSFLNKNKKVIIKGVKLQNTFFNSATPYNYFKVPLEKNTFLISFNGGPKVYTFVDKEKLNEEMETKKIIYGPEKSCGCFAKLYVPKLRRSLSSLYNLKINREKYNFQRPTSSAYNLWNKFNYNKKNRYMTPQTSRFIKDQRPQINNVFKRVDSAKNFYRNYFTNIINRKRINYEKAQKDQNDKKIVKRNEYESLLYDINRNIDKKFHKTQIFNNSKPYLSVGL